MQATAYEFRLLASGVCRASGVGRFLSEYFPWLLAVASVPDLYCMSCGAFSQLKINRIKCLESNPAMNF